MDIFDKSSNPSFPSAGYLFSVLLTIVAMAIFFTVDDGYPQYKRRSTAAAWPTTIGVVERSEVVETRWLRADSAHHRADIVIRYEVEGISYRIGEPYMGQSRVWRQSGDAHAEARRYRVGNPVKVYYSPLTPSLATVETDYQVFGFAFLWTAMVALIAVSTWYSTLEQTWRFVRANARSEDSDFRTRQD